MAAIHKALIANRHQFEVAEPGRTHERAFLIMQSERMPKLMSMRSNPLKCAYGLGSPPVKRYPFSHLIDETTRFAWILHNADEPQPNRFNQLNPLYPHTKNSKRIELIKRINFLFLHRFA
ncbi:MAG: hypothetical protein ACRENG_11725, partial [bacterium]